MTFFPRPEKKKIVQENVENKTPHYSFIIKTSF